MLDDHKIKLIYAGIVLFIILIFLSFVFYEQDAEEIVFLDETTTTTIMQEFYVDVKGAVKKPGVYKFKNGERVIDALDKAGGITKSGNTSNVNLSKKLESEMVVYIYTNQEIKKGSNKLNCDTKCDCEVLEVNNCYPDTSNTQAGMININTASLTEIQTLPGIGESKAKAVMNYREENGQFNNIDEIQNVSGIGPAVFANIKDKITV